ncbi:ADP-ribosylglycohydrolase family protein [Hathewaya histolytica]|uniref:ADP-ribosylglycohydrolase family protein n=1 Tax=Hathewaya histolytica TaxID=1498 RepID=UPI003B67C5C1
MENTFNIFKRRKNNELTKVKISKNQVMGGFFGFCIGDALGVPVEFMTREELEENLVLSMRGYGTYNQPPGTWSDDSSLTFCLADSLCNGLNYKDISKKFLKWRYEGKYTPYSVAFGVGNTTETAIENIYKGINPIECGCSGERDNGNGSLMRVLPLSYFLINTEDAKKFNIIHEVSSITHSHLRSKLACSIYVQFAIELLKGSDIKESYLRMQHNINEYYSGDEYKEEINNFHSILKEDISLCKKEEIKSTGYVIDTLYASIWCLLNSISYKETVLKAVNLGGDTDTIAAVAGGLAGIFYGIESIPKIWVQKIAKKAEIMNLINKFTKAMSKI